MKCKNGHIVSGDYCHYCEEKPEKKKRPRIPPVSERMKFQKKVYSEKRLEYLEKHPTCEYEGCNSLATEIHHKELRGKNLNNTNTFMAICREHHNDIHFVNTKIAKEKGYL